MKIAAQMSPEPSLTELQFVRQMGIEYAVLWTSGEKACYHYYASRRELFENAGIQIYAFGNGDVHCQDAMVLDLFRNVDQPLPHFVETFVDDGYWDMYQAMKVLREVNFDGVLIPDHIPVMADDYRLGTAYTIGYMQALLRRANEEVG